MNLSPLYYPGGDEKYNLFLKRNEDRILSLLPSSLTLSLSLFYLNGGNLGKRKLYEDLGLVNGMTVTQRGKRIISAYPLFGSGKEKRGYYSSSFFPFLFSLIGSSSIPRRFERYISSPSFLSLFPWRKEEELVETTVRTIESLIGLGIVKDNSSYLSLDTPSSLAFMEMDEISRLSYILTPSSFPRDRSKTKDYLTLAFLFNGVDKSDMEEKLEMVGAITKTSIPLSTLISFGIINYNGETYTSSRIMDDKCQKGIISPDLTISYRGKADIPLWRFALPLKADSLNQWTITKKSIKSALDSGMKKEEILSNLSSFSSSPLSPVIEERLSLWCEEYERITIERAVLINTEERVSRIIRLIPQMQSYIISNPSPNLFVMDGEKEEEWREMLAASGFDMLPVTKGPEFSKPHTSESIVPLPPSPTLPFERDVDYDKEEYCKILNNSKSFLQKCFVSSHAVFSSKTELKLDWIDGLEYREKRDRVLRAINDQDNLIIMDINEDPRIVRPIRLIEREDGDDLITERETLDLSKIWKVAAVPSYIRNPD